MHSMGPDTRLTPLRRMTGFGSESGRQAASLLDGAFDRIGR